jgi:hypothetical protein
MKEKSEKENNYYRKLNHKNETTKSDENFEILISAQQQSHQHIQRMSAKFISIALSVVLGGLGILFQVFRQDVFSFPLTGFSSQKFLVITFSSNIIGLLAAYVLVSVFFYSIVAIIIAVFGGVKLFECTRVEVLHPVKYFHKESAETINRFGISKENKRHWLANNSELTGSVTEQYKISRKYMLMAVTIGLMCLIGISGILIPEITNIISFLILFPILAVTILIYVYNNYTIQKLTGNITNILQPKYLFYLSLLIPVFGGLYYHIKGFTILLEYLI